MSDRSAGRSNVERANPVRRPGLHVGIVGVGPRGVSVLERLCANERASPSHDAVTVHLVDPALPGAGAVWRTGQSRSLLMNTVASQITVYTDDSVNIDGPVESGPTLDEWAGKLAASEAPELWEEEVLEEARVLGPDSYPSRAFYGHYLHACFTSIVASAPAHVRVCVYRTRAMAMADTHGVLDGPQGVRLESGSRLDYLDAIVLAQGHVPMRPTAKETRTISLARIHHMTYVTPRNPADASLDDIEAGRPLLLRGLGLGFFDYVALLTEGRGGSFHERDGRLAYRPSGHEPLLYGFSRRGVPHHARGRNQKGASQRYTPRLLTPETVSRIRQRAPGGLRFSTDLWPFIAREVESVYYSCLLRQRGRGRAGARLADRYLRAEQLEVSELLEEYGIIPEDRWSWERLDNPCAGHRFTDRGHFRSWILRRLEKDVADAEAGNVDGPLKAALDVLRDLRNEVRLAVDHGGLTGASYRDELQTWYTPLNAHLSIGPPVSRVRELLALIECGVVEILGPGTQVRFAPAESAFVASSPEVPGPPVPARALIEARLPTPDLRRTSDPLLNHLLHSEQATPYRIAGSEGSYETGGLSVTGRPYRLIDGRGRAHPRRFAYGVPTESVHWVTAAGTRPGVDSVTLGDADAIARAVLALDPTAHPPLTPINEADTDVTGVFV